ncbi:hypothetical protein D3C78_940260 [compost metagenome]
MAHADGEHQEGHQDRVRVQRIAQGRQHAELPDHGDQRGDHHRRGGAPAAGEPEQHRRAQQDGDGEEHQHGTHAVDEVADQLGEASDVHGIAARLVLGAQLLQRLGEHGIVHRPALAVGRQQRHEDHAGAEVGGHGMADLAGARQVGGELLQAGLGTVIAFGDHRPAFQAILGHPRPAGRWRPQRLHLHAVDPRQQEQLVAQLAQGLHVAGVVDAALGVGHGNPHGIAEPEQILLVRGEVLNVGVTLRNHLLEAGR